MKLIYVLWLTAATGWCANLTLSNGGVVNGAPGETVGWGFTLESVPLFINNTTITPWLLTTHVDFVLDGFQTPVGTFTPYMNGGTVIGPDAGNGEVNPWTQSFSAVLMTGLGEYAINSFQTPGDFVTGRILVTYNIYTRSPNDPLFNPLTDTFVTSDVVAADAFVNVTGVPEPGTLVLLAGGLGMLVARRCARLL